MRDNASPFYRHIGRRAVLVADTFVGTGVIRGVRADYRPMLAASARGSPAGQEQASSGRHEQLRLGKIFLASGRSSVSQSC